MLPKVFADHWRPQNDRLVYKRDERFYSCHALLVVKVLIANVSAIVTVQCRSGKVVAWSKPFRRRRSQSSVEFVWNFVLTSRLIVKQVAEDRDSSTMYLFAENFARGITHVGVGV